jgi:hypothetical protein
MRLSDVFISGTQNKFYTFISVPQSHKATKNKPKLSAFVSLWLFFFCSKLNKFL